MDRAKPLRTSIVPRSPGKTLPGALLILFILFSTAEVCYGITAQEHVTQAKDFLAKKEYAKAVSILTACTVAYPDDARCYGLRGTMYALQDRFREALSDFNRLLELSPDDPGAYIGRGSTYSSLREYDKAIRDFSTVISFGDRFLGIGYSMRGNAYQATSQHDRAIADFTRAIEIGPDHYALHLSRAESYFIQYRKQEFLSDCRKVYEINPRIEADNFCLRTAARKGLLDRVLTEPNKQLSSSNRMIDAAPKKAIGYFLRGSYYFHAGLYARATADLLKAAAIDPKDYDIWAVQGDLFTRQALYDKAITAYGKAVELKPGASDVRENLSLCYRKKGDYEEALATLTRAFAGELKNPFFLSSQAELYLLTGNRANALRSFEKALDILTKDIESGTSTADIYGNAAWSALFLSKFTEAEKYARRALSLDPRADSIHATLGHACLFQDKKADAFEEYRLFIERDQNETFFDQIEDLKNTFSLLMKRYPEKMSLLDWAQRQLWVR